MNFTISELKDALLAAKWLQSNCGKVPTALAVRDALILEYVEYDSELHCFVLTLKYLFAKEDLS